MDLIARKYRILKTLGQGAMGEVFLVLPPRGDPVALKLLKTGEGVQAKSAIEQFENEFKVLKKLSHPNIGKIYDYGFDEEQKKVYFTSPWLKGSDLYVASKGLSFDVIEEYFVQILRALNYLHQKEIIHCDLKPGNVFVEDGQILLIDFGLAGYWGQSIVGTPTYLAPEIFRGEHHSVSSDLYAVGVMMYNAFARAQPFAGKSLQEVYDRHRTHSPPPLSSLNADVPKYMSDIALTLLSKKPSERHANAGSIIEEISAFSKNKYAIETKETLLSYLPKNSELIGRDEAQYQIERQVASYLSEESQKNYHVLYLYGENGVGKTKFTNQIKTSLQLEKVAVEEVVLPLSASDEQVITHSRALILEDIEDYQSDGGEVQDETQVTIQQTDGRPAFGDFLSLLERLVLSTSAKRFYLIVTGTEKDQADSMIKLFPRDDLNLSVIPLQPFNVQETRLFLETIIGQKNIPDQFVKEIYRNTGGNPGICQQIIESLIEQGLLFDESGRWSEDLLNHLEGILKKVETPHSLEEKLEKEYASLNQEHKEIVLWLALSQQGLTEKSLKKLLSRWRLGRLLKEMSQAKIIRQEKDKRYVLYRSTFVPYIQKQLSQEEMSSRHDRLASEDIDLPQIQQWYHLSFGSDDQKAKQALQCLGDAFATLGDKEKSLECFERLKKGYRDESLSTRLDWVIRIAENLIHLDRFAQATEYLSEMERELSGKEIKIVPVKSRLLLWEKKGLSLLYQQRIKEASFYFSEGLKVSSNSKECQVEEISFMNRLAQVEMVTGNHKKAISRFVKSRELMASIPEEDRKKITNNDLGHVYFELGEYELAIQYLEQDIQSFSQLTYREPLARALYTLAQCLRNLKDVERAVKEYEKCIQICREDDFLPLLLRVYNGLGNIYLINEKFDEAIRNYQKAIELSVHLKDLTNKAALLANQGLIYKIQKNWAQSSRRFLLAKQILESKDKSLTYEQVLLSKCYAELAMIAKEENNPMKAITYQVERMQMVEDSAILKTEEYGINLDLAKLYLDNRLEAPFLSTIDKLKKIARSNEELDSIQKMEDEWNAIQKNDQDSTMEVTMDE